MRTHLFFPENDLALGRNIANYTAPRAATALRTSGQLLPLWFMAPDDCVVAQGVNRDWLRQISERFGLQTRIFEGYTPGLTAAPWGWSRASRRAFERLGFPPESLPTDDQLEAIRNLSHRRTALAIASLLNDGQTPVGEECNTIESVEAFVQSVGEAVVKLPWSSTGRGIVMLSAEEVGIFRKQIEGMIANQGSVTCEPRLRGVQDLAMLFTMEQGRARYEGLSVFRNASSGSYEGNILAPQEELWQMCADMLPDNAMERTSNQLPAILERIVGDAYEGPLGLDMLIYERSDGTNALDACIELNLRNTMGHVALRFYQNYCHQSFRGMFRISNTRPAEAPVIKEGRLAGGTLCLNPPGGTFAFVAEAAENCARTK